MTKVTADITPDSFKRGSKYTRKEVGWIVYPDEGRPKGGDWDTGYVTVGDNLIVFMNIGVPGKTKHDFPNEYDEKSGLIKWYGKPGRHSAQAQIASLLEGKLTPYYFARWDNTDPNFTYLGVGKIIDYQDGVVLDDGTTTIKFRVKVDDAEFILPTTAEATSNRLDFMFERQLEDFLVTNWDRTSFGNDYTLQSESAAFDGRQFRTDIGVLDILALKRDGSEWLVVELKRDRASDVVVGQVLRYMGWVEQNLCNEGQSVKGVIVALRSDAKLENALIPIRDKVSFVRYELDFRLIGEL